MLSFHNTNLLMALPWLKYLLPPQADRVKSSSLAGPTSPGQSNTTNLSGLVWIISAGSGVKGLSLVVSYLVPGPGLTRQRNIGPQCEHPIREAVGGVASGLAGLHMKGVLPGGRVVYYLQKLASSGKSSLSTVNKAPRCQSLRITESKNAWFIHSSLL